MLYDSDNEWANANATTWTNHTNNGEWGKQGPEGRRLYRRGYTEWSRSGQYMWGKEMRGGTGRSTGGCEVLLMFQKLMSSQVFITLNIWMRGPCQTQWWQYVMNHGYNQSLLSTWVPAPPPIKQWGDVMNRQFTEATAWTDNKHIQSKKCSIRDRNNKVSLYTQPMGKDSKFHNTSIGDEADPKKAVN